MMVRPEEWSWCLATCIFHACSLRVAAAQGWWDGAGYHRDEVELARGSKQTSPVYVGPPAPHGGSVRIARAA